MNGRMRRVLKLDEHGRIAVSVILDEVKRRHGCWRGRARL